MDKRYDVKYDHELTPWPMERVRAHVARYRAAIAQGSLEELRATADARDFEHRHPKLAMLLSKVDGDPGRTRLLEHLLALREARERGEVDDAREGTQMLESVLTYFRTEAESAPRTLSTSSSASPS